MGKSTTMIKMIFLLALVGLATGVELRRLYATPGVTSAEDCIRPPQSIGNLIELARVLKLSPDCKLKIERNRELYNGNSRVKLVIYCNGLPVRTFTLQATLDANGTFIGAVSGFIPNITSVNTAANIPPEDLKEILVNYLNEVNTRTDLEDATVKDLTSFFYRKEIEISLDSGEPRVVYYTKGTITGNSNRFPRAIVDGTTRQILEAEFVASTLLDPALKACPLVYGGNDKCIGPSYGPLVGQICINATVENGLTVLANDKLVVYNMNGKANKGKAEIFKFNAVIGPGDSINGARSPAVDAYYYGNQFLDFMRVWGKMTLNKIIKVYVHTGNEFANSFYDGDGIMFGDGKRDVSVPGKMVLHPTTVAEVVAHEAAHIVTDFLDNFNFRSETLGPNEAFSDISGVAFSAYLSKKGKVNRWSFGYCAVKPPNNAIRYFDDPSKDYFTYTHVDNYTSGGSGYRSSGIFTKPFYCMVELKNIPIEKAFDVLSFASQIYWGQATGILDAACGIYKAASDLCVETTAVDSCFKKVGIYLNSFCNLHGTGTGVSLVN